MNLTAKEAVGEQDPADWWQAFKEHWFNGWMLRRWPVEWKSTKMSARVLWPYIVVPERPDHFVIPQLTKSVVERPS